MTKAAPVWKTPEIRLSPDQIIEWLEGHRRMMIDVWKNNPELRKEWEKLNGNRKA